MPVPFSIECPRRTPTLPQRNHRYDIGFPQMLDEVCDIIPLVGQKIREL